MAGNLGGLTLAGNGLDLGCAMQPRHSPMRQALLQAEAAAASGEVPVGAVVVAETGEILSQAGNRTEALNDPTAHAELLALRQAAGLLGSPRLVTCDLYVTLEPCPMCAQAISLFRVRRLFFGAYDPKGGGVEHGPRIFSQPTCHHRPEIYGGICEAEAGALLKRFFGDKR
jgi:tRNA(adenine34) deaminase